MKKIVYTLIVLVGIAACSKKSATPPNPPPQPPPLSLTAIAVNGISNGNSYTNLSGKPAVKLSFSAPLDRNTVSGISLVNATGTSINTTVTYENDSVIVVTPTADLPYLSTFVLTVPATLASKAGGKLSAAVSVQLQTGIDPSPKYPTITDNELMDKVQRTTLKYFWDFGHPTSGLARERSNGDNNVVTTGGSGFGIMAIIAGADRGFITKAEALSRMQLIVDFLQNKAQRFHGAFPHWLNGTIGAVIPFSQKDNGADLVETAFLIQGLLCARQYFSAGNAAEVSLRNNINAIWQAVEWDWFRKNAEQQLYWHWSPDYNWEMNVPIRGWNECLVTYVLAAASPTHSIPKVVYDNGWAGNGSMKNGNIYYNIQLPLGPDFGGPLFFAHYSFLGINPTSLTDAYADYWKQNKNHTLINYTYCVNDPKAFGYNASLWGLTASDIPNGYTASSPTNDVGVIAPTAAISSMPYTPAESIKALKFFYYTLGDKIWKESGYGFVDAFSIKERWFANSYLAIDQGPIIVMIENYRSGLLWKLFMSCPEVKSGMKSLGFASPNLN